MSSKCNRGGCGSKRPNEPREGWNEFARQNPDMPLDKNDTEAYLSHLIAQHNEHVRSADEANNRNDLGWSAFCVVVIIVALATVAILLY